MDPSLRVRYRQWIQDISERRYVWEVFSLEQISRHLAGLVTPQTPVSSSHAIVIMDATPFMVSDPKLDKIFRELRLYMYMGGTLILAAAIDNDSATNELVKNLGRDWAVGPVKEVEG